MVLREDNRRAQRGSERAREERQGLWEGKGARGEENQTHPELLTRHRSHHRCSHRHSVWVVGRGVWRASMASLGLFFGLFARIRICRPAVCVNGDSNTAVVFKSIPLSRSWARGK